MIPSPDALRLAATLNDIPRWIETRAMLLSGHAQVTGGVTVEQGFVVKQRHGAVSAVAVVGRPSHEAILTALEEITPLTPVLAQIDDAPWVQGALATVSSAGTPWRGETVVVHALTDPDRVDAIVDQPLDRYAAPYENSILVTHNGGARCAPARERRGVSGPRKRPAFAQGYGGSAVAAAEAEPSRSVGRSPTLVRMLRPDDALEHLPPDLRHEMTHARMMGPVAAVFEDGLAASFCYPCWRTERLWDVSIDTLDEHRGKSFAVAAVRLMSHHMRREGRSPVWGALESNRASRRLAAKLGFIEVDRILVFSRGHWALLTGP